MKLQLTAYATRLPVAHTAFCALAAFLVMLSVWPPAIELEQLPPGAGFLTYAYAILLFFICMALLASRGILNLSERFLFAPLTLALAGGASLAYARIVDPDITTYSAGLIPLLICALPILVSTEDITINHAMMSKFIIFLLCTASCSHLIWQLASWAGVPVFPSHEQSFTFCFVMLLAGFTGRKVLFALAIVATLVSLSLRPTSTLFFSAALSLGSVLAYRLGCRWPIRIFMYSFIAAVLLANIGILSSADFAESVYSIEPYFKESVLDGKTNNVFRLGVINALRTETVSSSVLFGKHFSGNVNPVVSDVLPWWYDISGSEYAPVHSDFLLLLSQGGLVGYTLFATLLLGFAQLCITGARLSAALGEADLESFFDAVLVMEVVFAIYIMFNPMMQKPYIVAFFFFLVPICVFLVRGVVRAMSEETESVGGRRVGRRGLARAQAEGLGRCRR